MVRQEILDTMLQAYYPECRYLKEANFDFPKMESKFSIPKTFYGSQSGHFNATEMMMCYNQMSYAFFAKSLEEGLIEPVGTLPLNEFIKCQMGNCLLARLNNIKFKSQIDAKDFSGKIVLKKSPKRGNNVFVTTDFSFYDTNGGYASGEALIAFITKNA
jgi:hypothetical protein